MTPAKKLGRKPKPEAELRNKAFALKLSAEEDRLVRLAAAYDEDKPFNWGRRMIVIAARKRLAVEAVSISQAKETP